MEIFGYARKTLTKEGLLALKEVSFAASAEELATLAAFLSKAASEIKAGTMKTDHAHFPAPVSAPQVIVINPGTDAFRDTKKEPNQPPEPTRPFGPRGSS